MQKAAAMQTGVSVYINRLLPRGRAENFARPPAFRFAPRAALAQPFPEMSFPRHVENLIASFRGMPTNRSRSRPRDTVAIGQVIPGVLEKHRIGLPSIEDTISQNWTTLVGPANAQFVNLLKIENERRVFISVGDPIVRQELFFHRKLILDRIQALPGCREIREIVFRAG